VSWIVFIIAMFYFFMPLIATLEFSLRARPAGGAYLNTFKDARFFGSLFYSFVIGLITIVVSTLLIVPTAYWVRLKLPRPWVPVLGYLDLERKLHETGIAQPSARQVFDWVCAIRRAKLPDPAHIGNAGSFFKNPVVSEEQCRDIIGRDPEIVHYPMPDGSVKLAAGWLIDACGWKGKSIGRAGVYEKQALVLVNRGGASGAEVVTLARAIQESVYGRFGIRLEPEPVVV